MTTHPDNIGLAFSLDGKTVASGGTDDIIIVWNVESGKVIATLKGHTSYVWCVAFSPDGKSLASGGADKTIKLWTLPAGEKTKT